MTNSRTGKLKLVAGGLPEPPGKKEYRRLLKGLQIGLVRLQRHIIENERRVLVVLEGRDAAGKDGAIKRIIKHLSPRETRVVALSKPTEREEREWYYQRWVDHLPAKGEFVLYNRSWYNRAGVERVMGFCTQVEYDTFLDTVDDFERILISSRIEIVKYYLDIGRDEQAARMAARRKSPFKQWKISNIDEKALSLWDDYTVSRNQMLIKTHKELSPWTIVRADNKRLARLNVVRDMLHKLGEGVLGQDFDPPEPRIVFRFDQAALTDGRMAD